MGKKRWLPFAKKKKTHTQTKNTQTQTHTPQKPQIVGTFTHHHTHNASSFSSLTIKTGMISVWEKKTVSVAAHWGI